MSTKDSRYLLEGRLVLCKLDLVDEGAQICRILLVGSVIATEKLGQLLVIVEDLVGIGISTDGKVSPELLHEECLIAEVDRRS